MKIGVTSRNHSPLRNSSFVFAPKAINDAGSLDPRETIAINANTPMLIANSA